jgi:hypothetical protein
MQNARSCFISQKYQDVQQKPISKKSMVVPEWWKTQRRNLYQYLLQYEPGIHSPKQEWCLRLDHKQVVYAILVMQSLLCNFGHAASAMQSSPFNHWALIVELIRVVIRIIIIIRILLEYINSLEM